MEIFTFDRAEHEENRHGSVGLHVTRIARFTQTAQAACLVVAPGGLIGTHPASDHQVLLIVSGAGWVAGSDGVHVAVTAGQAAYWAPGEIHTTGSDTGLTAIALEGSQVTVFGPETR